MSTRKQTPRKKRAVSAHAATRRSSRSSSLDESLDSNISVGEDAKYNIFRKAVKHFTPGKKGPTSPTNLHHSRRVFGGFTTINVAFNRRNGQKPEMRVTRSSVPIHELSSKEMQKFDTMMSRMFRQGFIYPEAFLGENNGSGSPIFLPSGSSTPPPPSLKLDIGTHHSPFKRPYPRRMSKG